MTKLIDCNQLTDEAIANMGAAELINSVLVSFDIPDVIERERIQALMQIRAAEVGAKVVIKTSSLKLILKNHRRKIETTLTCA